MTGIAPRRSWIRSRGVVLALLVGASIGMGCGVFGRSEEPVVSVGKGLRPEIAWTPGPAYLLRVYPGSEDGDGMGVLWTVGGPGGYENALHSPVTYGVPPVGSEYGGAPPLEAGKTYTVTVTVMDESGSGDGFFNTRRDKVGAHTFVASE